MFLHLGNNKNILTLGYLGDGEKNVGAVIDAVMMIANQPCALAISCGNQGYTKQTIDKSLTFNLSVLAKDVSPDIIANFGFFSSSERKKWNFVKYHNYIL